MFSVNTEGLLSELNLRAEQFMKSYFEFPRMSSLRDTEERKERIVNRKIHNMKKR